LYVGIPCGKSTTKGRRTPWKTGLLKNDLCDFEYKNFRRRFEFKKRTHFIDAIRIIVWESSLSVALVFLKLDSRY
jgi:hypothetical protein